MQKFEFNFSGAGTSIPATQAILRQQLDKLTAMVQRSIDLTREDPAGIDHTIWSHVPVFLALDTENIYDPNCIIVMLNTTVGAQKIASVPARRYCPSCNPMRNDKVDRGYPSYGADQRWNCAKHGEQLIELMSSYTDEIAPLLRTPGVYQDFFARFVGGTEGKPTIGVVVFGQIMVPEPGETGGDFINVGDMEKDTVSTSIPEDFFDF